jgi:anti-anti-sigma factor
MPVTLDQGGALCVVRLQGEISVGFAKELKVALLQALASGTEVRLSLEDVSELDVTAVQLLWAAEHEARRSGKPFEFAGPAPADVLKALDEAGFEKFPFADNAK